MLPTRCVFAGARERCSLFVDHYRRRKTGPRYAVAVVGCTAHPQGRYTLYPAGHFPYGREAVVPYSPSGVLLVDAGRGHGSCPAWGATLFAAAVDAASGERWSSQSPWDDARRRRTQGRRLRFAARLLGVDPLGVDPEMGEGVRERIATRLGVATMTLLSGARGWSRSWTQRGEAIVAVLEVLPLEASLLDRVLAAGAVGGVWPAPRRWDAVRGTWIVVRSRQPEHPDVRRPRSRGPPPTTLPGAGLGEGTPSSDS